MSNLQPERIYVPLQSLAEHASARLFRICQLDGNEAEYIRPDLSPVPNAPVVEPRLMTDAELKAAIDFHAAAKNRFANELAKVWRLRVRTGHATDDDKQRAAELEAARASASPQPQG